MIFEVLSEPLLLNFVSFRLFSDRNIQNQNTRKFYRTVLQNDFVKNQNNK